MVDSIGEKVCFAAAFVIFWGFAVQVVIKTIGYLGIYCSTFQDGNYLGTCRLR